jgi:MarR family transcriptional regulator, organic hydroperoxide resistance regulator
MQVFGRFLSHPLLEFSFISMLLCSNHDMYKLDNSLPYLLNRVGVRIGELFAEKLRPYDITLPMYRVLASLVERSGQQLNELSEITNLEMSTLSRMISTMEKRELLVRSRTAANARIVSISLTPKGKKLALTLIPIAQHFEEVAIHSFGVQQVAKLRTTLKQVYEHLSELEQ